MRAWKKMLLILLGAIALLGLFVVWKIGPRNLYGLARYGTQRREGNLRVGDTAPDVRLVSLDGKSPVLLSERTGSKPLVLVFGSYT
ncbi:MAG TPA: hypothetical protein VFW15_03780 [Thermoanaerobaculia bacterium]|nr:hypothetical protein [Thermoanaerobaculia bacterium]